jgi:hypothetical protein
MQKPNHHSKSRPASAVSGKSKKNKEILYIRHGKKITGKLMNIFNYQYKDSDLEQFVY